MTRSELELLHKRLRKELVHREGLGGYSQEAECLLLLTEATYKLSQHLLDRMPKRKEQYDELG